MTGAEIVALVARALRKSRVKQHPELEHFAEGLLDTVYLGDAAAVVAALTEAGRLVPAGCVCIDAGRWERVRRYADVVLDGALCSGDGDVFLTGESHDAMLALMSGDFDAEPTP